MKIYRVVLAAVLAAAVGTVEGAERALAGQVVAIADGDTLTLLDAGKTQHAVRIAGIDAPERKQPYGVASRAHLSSLIFKRQAEVRCHKRDRYGREVCRVFTEGGRDVGLEQVRAGMAWWFREYAHEQTPEERLVYQDEEEAAKMAKRGLWMDPKPVPPWEWRAPR